MNISRTGEIAVSDETVVDTLMDLAVYAILTRILYENSKAGKIRKTGVIEWALYVDPPCHLENYKMLTLFLFV